MSFWQIVTPAAAQNLVANPTVKPGTSGYTVVNSAIAQDAAKTRRGVNCLKVTPTANTTAGVYFGTVALVSGTTYYFSCDFWGAAGVPYQIYIATTGGVLKGTAAQVIGAGYWNPARLEASWTCDNSTNYRLYIVKNNSASTADFWIDGLMVTTISQSTYIDGAQSGCAWDGAPFASTSTRSAQSRDGGQIIDLDTFDLAVEEWDGVGMADITNILLPYGMQDGSYFQRQKAPARGFTLRSTINANLPGNPPNDLPSLFANRKGLIDAIKPDAVDPQQPFWLRCSAPAKPMWIRALYQDGLKMRYNQGFIDEPNPMLVCPDPYWYEDGVNCVTMNGYATVANANRILQQLPTNAIAALGTGAADGAVSALVIGPDGCLYAGGSFTGMGGVANTSRIAKWDPVAQAWSALGTGAADGAVLALAFGPDGSLYAGGTFTGMGGVASTANLAKWSAGAWSSIGVLNGDVRCLTFGPNGILYAGGSFTTAAGVTVNRIARWTGAAWTALGTGASGNIVYAIAVGSDNKLYAGGFFPSMGGVANTQYIAMWDGNTSSWVSLGSASAPVNAIAIGPDGRVYAGGDFTQIGPVAPGYANCIAVWNGFSWSPLGSGVSGGGSPSVKCLLFDNNGILYVGGNFQVAGGLALPDCIATWNGSVWSPISADLPGVGTIVSAIARSITRKTTYAGFSAAGAATGPTYAVINNVGSARSFPVIAFNNAGTLTQIVNAANGKQISFSSLTLLAGETAVLDLTPGNISFTSNFRGNLMGYIAPGSNLSSFALMPGSNGFTVYSALGANSVTVQWRNRSWSIDGGA